MGGEAQQAMEPSVLEDQPGHPEGSTGGQQAGEHPECGNEGCLQGHQQHQEAEEQHQADHLGCLGSQHDLEVMVLGGSPADQRAWGQGAPQPVDGGPDRR